MLDNLLTRVGSSLNLVGRQGVERRIPVVALEDLALTLELTTRVGVPAPMAFALARQLLGRDALDRAATSGEAGATFVGSITLGSLIHIGVDLRALRDELHARLEHAIESQVRPRRGRPRTTPRTR